MRGAFVRRPRHLNGRRKKKRKPGLAPPEGTKKKRKRKGQLRPRACADLDRRKRETKSPRSGPRKGERKELHRLLLTARAGA